MVVEGVTVDMNMRKEVNMSIVIVITNMMVTKGRRNLMKNFIFEKKKKEVMGFKVMIIFWVYAKHIALVFHIGVIVMHALGLIKGKDVPEMA